MFLMLGLLPLSHSLVFRIPADCPGVHAFCLWPRPVPIPSGPVSLATQLAWLAHLAWSPKLLLFLFIEHLVCVVLFEACCANIFPLSRSQLGTVLCRSTASQVSHTAQVLWECHLPSGGGSSSLFPQSGLFYSQLPPFSCLGFLDPHFCAGVDSTERVSDWPEATQEPWLCEGGW